MLRSAPEAIDLSVLKLIAEDPAIVVKRGAPARRLWAACGLPDFRKVGPMHHARMVRRLFSYIGEGGHVPHEWFAAEVARLDNMSGDIEVLADRLAGIRSWAYRAPRRLAEGAGEMGRAHARGRGAPERRASRTADPALRRPPDGGAGARHRRARRGRIAGHRRRRRRGQRRARTDRPSRRLRVPGRSVGAPRRQAPAARRRRAPPRRGAGPPRRGADRSGRRELRAHRRGNGGLAVAWEGHVLARLAPGARCSSRRSARRERSTGCRRQTRAAFRERLERWVETQVDRDLRPLKQLAAAATDPARSPGVRALAAMLADAGGVLPRKAALSAIAHLEQADRQALHRLQGSLGPLDVFVPPLLKPAAQHWRAALLAVRRDSRCPRARAGAATLAPKPIRAAPRSLTAARPRMAPHHLADRLASHAHKVRSAGGADPVDAGARDVGRPRRRSIGAADGRRRLNPRGDAWRWRGRRAPRPDRRPAGSHAFAELAKLKKK